MSELAEAVRNKSERNKSIQWLFTAESGAVIGAAAGLADLLDDNRYRAWDEAFTKNVESLSDEQMRSTEEYLRGLGVRYGLEEGFRLEDLSTDLREIASSRLRYMGVANRWEWSEFFLRPEVKAPESVFRFTDNTGAPAQMTPDQLGFVRSEGRIPGFTAHHKYSVSALEQGDLARAADPDYIEYYESQEAHRLFGHGGDFREPLHGEGGEIRGRISDIREHNKDNDFFKEWSQVIAGVALGALGAYLKYREMRNDPRPWKRAALVASVFAFEGLQGYGIAVAACGASELLKGAMAGSIDEYLTLFGSEASGNMFLSVFGTAGAVQTAVTLRLGVRAVRDIIRGTPVGTAMRDFGGAVTKAAVEQVGFVIVSIALDCLTPIPDPILGPTITAIRITYSLIKFVFNIRSERASHRECFEARLDYLYEGLAASLA